MSTAVKKRKNDNQEEGYSSQTIDPPKKVKKEPKNESHVQLSTSVWIFFDEKLSDHADIFAGKQLHGHFASLPIVVKLVEKNERNKREARILSKLCYHSNVISLVETGFYEGSFGNYIYIAMDKCHNENLRDFVESRKEITFGRKCDILKQIITGMEFIHARNIAHLDLKPDNIFFTLDQETIKIADFGLSEELDEKKKFVEYQFGTDGFRPPESFGKSFISLKSDIFLLGIIFYFVLSNGKNPFGEDLDDQNSNIKNGLVDLSCLLVPNPRTTEHLLKCMLDMKHSNRPTISQVSKHPCWTGNEVECDFDYKTCETPPDFKSYDKDEEPYCNLEDLSTLQALLERHPMKDSEAQMPCNIMAQIVMKDEKVLVLLYTQQCQEISDIIRHLTANERFKLVSLTPLSICKSTDSSIQLQLIVCPPNEKDITIIPSFHGVDIEGILRGPPVSFTFLCKLQKAEVDAVIEFRVKEDSDINFSYLFEFSRYRKKQRAPGESLVVSESITLNQYHIIDISASDIHVIGHQENQQPRSSAIAFVADSTIQPYHIMHTGSQQYQQPQFEEEPESHQAKELAKSIDESTYQE